LWQVILVSPSAQPESDSAQKTLATSGHTSPDQYELFDLDYASLKMSKDTSVWASEKSLESWNQSVTKRRGEYSARLKSAHRTRESGSLSWPTIRASEYKDTGPIGPKSHDRMLGKGYLCAVVTQDAANWPTASMSMTAGYSERDNCNSSKKAGHVGNELLRQVIKHGQAAPANPSTDGSRQGLWPTITAHTPDMESSGPNGNSGTYLAGAVKAWATPRAGKTTDENPETWAARQAKGDVATMPLTAQVKLWRTPSVAEEKNQNTSTQIYLQNQVGATPKVWRTPSSSDGEGGVMEMREGCAGKYKLRDHVVAEQKQWGTPAANDANKTPHCEVNSNQAGLAKSVGLELQKQWGTPTARDHKSGRGNEEREYKELTPMVERTQSGKLNPRWVSVLMNLPVFWVKP
jgi:hypothetical protein